MSKFSLSTVKKLLHTFLKSDYAKALGIAIIWQIVLILFALIINKAIAPAIPHSASPVGEGLFFKYTTNWDGAWYLNITHGAYSDLNSPAPVFYPLFPTLVWLLGKMSFGLIDLSIIGMLVNTASLSVAIFALKKITTITLPKVEPWLPVTLFLLMPSAIFLNMFYVEALLCALGFLAYYYALKDRWLVCCLLLAFATATKLSAILFVGLCGLEFVRAHGWSLKKVVTDYKLLYFLIAPVGFVAYAVYLHFAHHDSLAMFNDIKPWTYQQFNPNIIQTITESYSHIVTALLTHTFDNITFVNFALPLFTIIITLLASIYCIIYMKNISLGVFGLFAVVFTTLNSNLVSVHRYLLPIFVVYIAIAHLHQNRHARPIIYGAVYLGILTQALLFTLFALNIFAG